MKINNSPTFGSKILYTAKLKKNVVLGLQKDISVFISELEKQDIDTIKNTNSILTNTSYGGQALCSFANECINPASELSAGKRFIVVETAKKSSADAYKGIAQITDKDNCIFVERLQSLSYIPIYKDIKGIGSCLMYAVFKIAEQLKRNSVTLNADFNAAEFYRKIKMYPITPFGYTFSTHHSRFKKVAKQLQNRFNIQEYKA